MTPSTASPKESVASFTRQVKSADWIAGAAWQVWKATVNSRPALIDDVVTTTSRSPYSRSLGALSAPVGRLVMLAETPAPVPATATLVSG